MSLTVRTIFEAIDAIAPYRIAFQSFDNVGLICGSADRPVTRALFTLDLGMSAIEAAKKGGYELIVSHHPVIFDPIRKINCANYDGRRFLALAEAGISAICAHTNWDSANGGVNDVLAKLLKLGSVEKFGFAEPQKEGQELMPSGRIGKLSEPLSVAEFRHQLSETLSFPVTSWGDRESVQRIAVVGGAADGEWHAALRAGADAFVTGEVRQHNALEASEAGMVIFQAGHYNTEHPAMEELSVRVKAAVPELEVGVFTPVPGSSGRPAAG